MIKVSHFVCVMSWVKGAIKLVNLVIIGIKNSNIWN